VSDDKKRDAATTEAMDEAERRVQAKIDAAAAEVFSPGQRADAYFTGLRRALGALERFARVEATAEAAKASTWWSRPNEMGPRTLMCMSQTPPSAAANFTKNNRPYTVYVTCGGANASLARISPRNPKASNDSQ
jgi:hypothetical protein